MKSESDTESVQPDPLDNKQKLNNFLKLAIGSLGIVYGDLGTSPLYTIKECFHLANNLTLNEVSVLGVLSLIFWSLSLVVIWKYIVFIMRADNFGEGGMMALISLIQSVAKDKNIRLFGILVLLGTFGTALLLSEGILTPAITVLSAIEGLEVITPSLKTFVVPITIVILLALFLVQKKGTAGIGAVFGPIMIVWFVMIGVLGLLKVIQEPAVLQAVNPYYAVQFFMHYKLAGFFLLGAVVLCFTGCEALYADMGHFGRKPIQFSWLFFVYPCLLLNYFGQGANILLKGQAVLQNPFYSLAEGWLIYPMIVIATLASIIASQALISGAFSLTQQATQLGFLPRLNVIHTSYDIHGQIYIPEVNNILMIACITLVILFKSSTNLASAYGMSVLGSMTITSILIFTVAVYKWGWKRWKAGLIAGLFLTLELPYLSANLLKLLHGAWIPLAIASVVFILMMTWKRGRQEIQRFFSHGRFPLEPFVQEIKMETQNLLRVKGTAVFMTSDISIVPSVMLHHIKHNKVLHEKVILLSVQTERVPEVPPNRKIEVRILQGGFYQVIARYGYMEKPNIPNMLKKCSDLGLHFDVSQISYFLGHETLLTTGHTKLFSWQKNVFAFLSRNARPASLYFKLPPNRVIELGVQVEL